VRWEFGWKQAVIYKQIRLVEAFQVVPTLWTLEGEWQRLNATNTMEALHVIFWKAGHFGAGQSNRPQVTEGIRRACYRILRPSKRNGRRNVKQSKCTSRRL